MASDNSSSGSVLGSWSVDALLHKKSDSKSAVNGSEIEPTGLSVESSGRKISEVKRAVPSAGGFDVSISAECSIFGNLELKGNAQIDGLIEGQIISEGELRIGETAQVKAPIKAEKVIILGRVIGDVVCSERLELFAGAQLTGNIFCPRLVVHDGAVFDGSIRMEPPRHSRQSAAGGRDSGNVLDFPASPYEFADKEE